MTDVWGIHCDEPLVDFIEGGFISLGWDEIGDLREVGATRAAIRSAVEAAYPDAKSGAIPVWAGVLYRFAFVLAEGDVVVYPQKADRTVYVGRVTGSYAWEGKAEVHRHRRAVEWLARELPRSGFSQPALYEIGSALTFFRVKTHADEFLAPIGIDQGASATASPEEADVVAAQEIEESTSEAEDSPSARRLEQAAPDFILKALATRAKGHAFEHFVAHLLQAMGYRTKVTVASGDGGTDVMAHRDPLGVEPPLVRVQCKSTEGRLGSEDVQKLMATLRDQTELGVLVTLGTFSKEARVIARNQARIQLIAGDDLARLVLEHYDRLGPETKRLIPLRQVWLPDPEA